MIIIGCADWLFGEVKLRELCLLLKESVVPLIVHGFIYIGFRFTSFVQLVPDFICFDWLGSHNENQERSIPPKQTYQDAKDGFDSQTIHQHGNDQPEEQGEVFGVSSSVDLAKQKQTDPNCQYSHSATDNLGSLDGFLLLLDQQLPSENNSSGLKELVKKKQ